MALRGWVTAALARGAVRALRGACLAVGCVRSACVSLSVEAGCCFTAAALELPYAVAAAAAAASAGREAVLGLLCQPGESTRVCTSCGSSHLLLAS